ncbi:TPM domain-containing protein [uncultured Erythrobacter sp.]|uniref:TPM domain-containing protein n=1 Tax=uncultured Erythrobacter sp. TaxID=263913 RepID=UPI00260DC809|nr:TPM domain-containing protein [uncultured Erythrobacter sp.]
MSKSVLLTGLAALLLSGCAAETSADISADTANSGSPAFKLSGRVVDTADIISEPVERELTEALAAFENEIGPQLVVATTPSLDGYDISTYSFDLANAWGLGSAERNDGLLVLVAPNERQVRIEVGLGLETSVKDEEASRIIQEDMLPHFRNGNYESGIVAGVDSLIDEATTYELKEAA